MRLQQADIGFREIAAADFEAVAALLARGFPNRKPALWLRSLQQLDRHRQPPGLPKYGYVMEASGAAVGVILTIFALVRSGGATSMRCNPCAWYVEPAFRAYAGLLFARALEQKQVTYVNVSAAPHTERLIEALGFARYCSGSFVAMPLLDPASGERGAKVFDATDGRYRPPKDVDACEHELLLRHAEYGCISVWCATAERRYPFVFHRRLVKGCLPCAQLIYCRAVEDFARLAAPIGRFLARRAIFFVIVGSNGPVPGLIGTFRPGILPRYFKGPQAPSLADVAYTEFAVLGV
jgi:hypothetical protein